MIIPITIQFQSQIVQVALCSLWIVIDSIESSCIVIPFSFLQEWVLRKTGPRLPSYADAITL